MDRAAVGGPARSRCSAPRPRRTTSRRGASAPVAAVGETRPDGSPARAAMRVIRQPPLLDRRAQVAALCARDRIDDRLRRRRRAVRARSPRISPARAAPVALLHSFETDAATHRRLAARGAAATASSSAAGSPRSRPFPTCRAAIVVDDADEALQEERSPTWHARDVLGERARARRGAVHRVLARADRRGDRRGRRRRRGRGAAARRRGRGLAACPGRRPPRRAAGLGICCRRRSPTRCTTPTGSRCAS